MRIIEELERHWGVFPNSCCHCGCGGKPKGESAHFLPGHDPFFAPNLVEALRANPDIAAAIRKLTECPPES